MTVIVLAYKYSVRLRRGCSAKIAVAAALLKVYATRGGNFAVGACARMYNRLESSRLAGPPSVAFPIGSAFGRHSGKGGIGGMDVFQAQEQIV